MTEHALAASMAHHRARGPAWDIVDEAILAYDEWMLDDDYDARSTLHRIVERMRERRALYRDNITLASQEKP